MERNNISVLAQHHTIIIGIDTGTKTGVAVWHKTERRFLHVVTMPIHRAMELVLQYQVDHAEDLFVRFEDARLRKWLKDKSADAIQGAGSIKRDCTIWEDFLKDKGIHFASIAPRGGLTKLPPETFARMTGWTERTSNHARDAAMLVYGF
jgi:hypothetical protein